ncbi:MAG: hypothetical protein AAGA81_18785 [Acidobacteriota bacterium]
MHPQDLLFNLLVLIPAIVLLGAYRQKRCFSPVVALAFGAWVGQWTFVLADDLFGVLRNVAWLLFVQLTLGLLVLALLDRWRTTSVVGAVSLVAVGVWAFQIEPELLEVSRTRIETSKLSQPLTVAVLADLQTDAPGDYELGVLRQLAALEADLVLLTGDYLQTLTMEDGEREAQKFRELWRAAGVTAPRGVFAVQGDVDPARWEARFAGLGIETSSRTTTFLDEELELVGLSLADSRDPRLRLAAPSKFRLVFGHRPDFALGGSQGDLLIAGHTHGGQVRVPGYGPLITFSSVPRSWAAGLTQLASERWLLVSRGVGMERGQAPRLRLFCRPEIALLEIVPSSASEREA